MNDQSWGIFTKNTIDRHTSSSFHRHDENRHYGTHPDENFDSGDVEGYRHYMDYETNYNERMAKTNLVFGAETYTFKLTNLPNFNIVPSTAASGTVYGHKGEDGHYYLCVKP